MRRTSILLTLATAALAGCATSNGVAEPDGAPAAQEFTDLAPASPGGVAGEAAVDEATTEAVVPYEKQDAATREANARLKDYFPNHELTTQDGEVVRFYDDLVRDRKVLINFMYVKCDGL